MPNHCTNHLTLTGSKEQLEKFREENTYKSGEDTDDTELGRLDFNGSAPMPEELKGISRQSGPKGHVYYRYLGQEDFPEITEDMHLSGQEVIGLVNKYDPNPDEEDYQGPCIWWYPWNCENWGTKWNAYDQGEPMMHPDEPTDGGEEWFIHHEFTTAWSPPTEWMLKASEKYPEIQFENHWSEEGGEFGILEMKEGKVTA